MIREAYSIGCSGGGYGPSVMLDKQTKKILLLRDDAPNWGDAHFIRGHDYNEDAPGAIEYLKKNEYYGLLNHIRHIQNGCYDPEKGVAFFKDGEQKTVFLEPYEAISPRTLMYYLKNGYVIGPCKRNPNEQNYVTL